MGRPWKTTLTDVSTEVARAAISLSDARQHVRVDADEDDAMLLACILAATKYVEGYTRRALARRTFELTCDYFVDELILQKPPFVSLTSIQYRDRDEQLQTLAAANYFLDDRSQYARVLCAYQQTWPEVSYNPNAVLVTYQAGYTVVPEDVKFAVRMLTGHFYENREAELIGSISKELEFSVTALLARFRVPLVEQVHHDARR